jgi:signal transduction histidine kinase
MLKQDTLFALDISVLAAAIVASVAGYFMAKRLTRPIKDLTATTERIAQGDLAARTNVRGIDEVARLGMAIDEMACAIERDRVQERRITTDMAHEIRTPLMAIRATVEAMIDGVFEADEEHLQVVEDEVLRISRLVEQLMRLSRLESHSTPFKKEEVDLSSIVSDVAMSFTALAEEAGLSMICDVAPDVRIVGDPDMTKQAVTNLVSNAIRYTSAGFVHISLAREGCMTRVDVQDSGVGLSEQDQEVVFDRLWRADSARESNNGGLGIGLAMVREIMDRMGGRVSVKSRLGEGSTFTLYFPLPDL